jgi:hypothetical protein
MNQCIECGKVDEIYDEMEKVVNAAELLVDAAGLDTFSKEAVATAGNLLNQAVERYRRTVEEFERGRKEYERGRDAVQ